MWQNQTTENQKLFSGANLPKSLYPTWAAKKPNFQKSFIFWLLWKFVQGHCLCGNLVPQLSGNDRTPPSFYCLTSEIKYTDQTSITCREGCIKRNETLNSHLKNVCRTSKSTDYCGLITKPCAGSSLVLLAHCIKLIYSAVPELPLMIHFLQHLWLLSQEQSSRHRPLTLLLPQSTAK